MSHKTKIWLDVDTGHDDAFAILLAAYHPKAELLGVSTVYGNASLQHTTYNTRAILRAIGKEDVPIYVGAAKPFCREVAHAEDIHGATGLDGTTCLPVPTVAARTDRIATEAIYKELRGTEKGTVWIIATGALTNIALLFAVHPDMVDHVAGVSIMGGAIGDGFARLQHGQDMRAHQRIGNWTAWAEFNIYIDPESAKAVLTDARLQGKLRMAPLDLTHQFIATAAVQSRLLADDGDSSSINNVRKLFVEILTFFAQTYANVFGLMEGPPLHDPLAVAMVLEPELFQHGAAEQFKVEVITDGEHGSSPTVRAASSQCGRTVVSALAQSDVGRGVLIPRTLNQAELWDVIETALATAAQSV